ncbi:MAG: prephenate dehydratase [Acidimicrobiales bacterium]|nr:prephenate dehydratase [Acidimicrobiales bacterium]
MTDPAPRLRVGFLGPHGTFTEQALLTQPYLAAAELVALPTIPDVLEATESGHTDVGFVPIENSIEGTVNLTIDTLAFGTRLLIQREVVLEIEMHLLAAPGVALADVRRVVSFPHAWAQCRRFLHEHLPGVDLVAATSTAEAARLAGEDPRPDTAAIAPALAGKLYGLEALATDIEDHDTNQTRFVVVARDGVPAPTGHDKTSVVVYQRANVPGSLISILQEFAARTINLSKLESRPTKSGGLGDYCFIIDFEGHVADELVADTLRDLRVKHGGVKFLGSYPAGTGKGAELRREADAAWREADEWLADLRARVGAGPLGGVGGPGGAG